MVATVFQNGYKHAKAALPHQQVAQTHRQKIKDMLPNRVVGYSPDLARMVGGATTGLFLSQLLFLSDKGANPDGWVYKSEQEMGKETGLTKREQQTARRKLLSLGVITIMRGGWKNTYHFKVIWEKLYQVIAGIKRPQTVPTEKSESVQKGVFRLFGDRRVGEHTARQGLLSLATWSPINAGHNPRSSLPAWFVRKNCPTSGT
jgi:hypothetical protein